MDDSRFDALVRAIGSGASRRSVLKGLLGIGGAIVAAEHADARSIATRPTIPPPPPPACLLPKKICDGVCWDADKCKDGHRCSNSADVWCGNACCDTGVCTTDGDCCLASQKACGSTCCPASHSCARDGNQDICCDPATNYPCGLECCDEEFQCCDKECCPPGAVCLVRVLGGESDSVEEEMCCPAESVCEDRCCPGETPQCCTIDGVSTCISANACCGDCGECQDCISGVCVDRCATCEVCEDENCFPCGGEGGGVCCDGICERESECCNDDDCVERYAEASPGCMTCVAGQCQRLGDSTGGSECELSGEEGTCCHGTCITASVSCTDCMDVGESCFGFLPCCDGLECDILANFTCLAPTTTTTAAAPTTTTTPACLPDFSIECEVGTQCCSGECRDSQASMHCGPNVGEIQPHHFFCCGQEGAGCDGQECCCEGLICQIPDFEEFGHCVTPTTPTSTTIPPCVSDSNCGRLDNPALCITGFCRGDGVCEPQGCGPSFVCCGTGTCQQCCGDDRSNCPFGWGFDVACSRCDNGVCAADRAGLPCDDDGSICNEFGVCLPPM